MDLRPSPVRKPRRGGIPNHLRQLFRLGGPGRVLPMALLGRRRKRRSWADEKLERIVKRVLRGKKHFDLLHCNGGSAYSFAQGRAQPEKPAQNLLLDVRSREGTLLELRSAVLRFEFAVRSLARRFVSIICG